MNMIAAVVGIWLSAWVIRKRAEIDERLDKISIACRWGVVLVGFAIAQLPGPQFRTARLIGEWVALPFLCWPNLAYQVTRQLRRDAADRQR